MLCNRWKVENDDQVGKMKENPKGKKRANGRIVLIISVHARTVRPTWCRALDCSQGHQFKQISLFSLLFSSFRARVTADAFKYGASERQHVQLFPIWLKQKTLLSTFPVFCLCLTRIGNVSAVRVWFSSFLPRRRRKKNRSKDASGLTDQSHEKEEDDGCDLDRTYVRDKHLLWPSELSWTDRQTDSQSDESWLKSGVKNEWTNDFRVRQAQLFFLLP